MRAAKGAVDRREIYVVITTAGLSILHISRLAIFIFGVAHASASAFWVLILKQMVAICSNI
jgi:hypothetical protein